MERIQTDKIVSDLEKKMVLLSGPRQVGKSWLARSLMTRFNKPCYLNYDNTQDREIIRDMAWPSSTDFLILDELHKMPEWKNHLKGIYDTRPPALRILVTGSARLETFRQGGDGLAGRYYQHRLLPLSPAEISAAGMEPDLGRLMDRGAFPEPYLTENAADAGRWRRQYLDGLIREDILSIENVRELRSMSLLVELLRDRVGSPLSYQGIAEDLGIAPNTVRRYLEILEALYIIFLIHPHADSIARSLVKSPKLYFFDTGLVRADEGKRFENMVALCLLKRISYLEDLDGLPRRLAYLRTKEGKGVDFLEVEDGRPIRMVEAKLSERQVAPALRYFNTRYGITALQVVLDLRQEYDSGEIAVRRAAQWLASLEA